MTFHQNSLQQNSFYITTFKTTISLSQRFLQPAFSTPALPAWSKRRFHPVKLQQYLHYLLFLISEVSYHSLCVYFWTMHKFTSVIRDYPYLSQGKHKKKLLLFLRVTEHWHKSWWGPSDRVRRGGVVSVLGDTQTPMGRGPGKPTLSRGLDYMTSRGPFQPQLFRDLNLACAYHLRTNQTGQALCLVMGTTALFPPYINTRESKKPPFFLQIATITRRNCYKCVIKI